jgi:hypothetical protein
VTQKFQKDEPLLNYQIKPCILVQVFLQQRNPHQCVDNTLTKDMARDLGRPPPPKKLKLQEYPDLGYFNADPRDGIKT